MLAMKSKATQRNYKRYIKAFLKEVGKGANHFIQDDIDNYFARLHMLDQRKPVAEQECQSTKVSRKAALRFYLNKCLKLNIDFSDYKTRSNR